MGATAWAVRAEVLRARKFWRTTSAVRGEPSWKRTFGPQGHRPGRHVGVGGHRGGQVGADGPVGGHRGEGVEDGVGVGQAGVVEVGGGGQEAVDLRTHGDDDGAAPLGLGRAHPGDGGAWCCWDPAFGVDAPQAESRAGAPTPARARPAAEAAPRPRNVLRSYRSAESATVPPSGRALVPLAGLSGSAHTPHPEGPRPSRFL